jgi:hypothetical protein
LTGADLHYWFIEGFGDVERLKTSHFAPIDVPIMHSIISLAVQEYFCYRIWTLNKRLLWFCIVIAIVRNFPNLVPSRSRHDRSRIQVGVVQSTGAAWGGIMASNVPTVSGVHIFTVIQSVVSRGYAVSKPALYVRIAVPSGSSFQLIV